MYQRAELYGGEIIWHSTDNYFVCGSAKYLMAVRIIGRPAAYGMNADVFAMNTLINSLGLMFTNEYFLTQK